MKKNRFLVDGRRVLNAKPELTLSYLQAKYPTKRFERLTGRVPGIKKLEDWLYDGVAETPICQCRVEPDGDCHHGRSSWIVCLGYI